MRRMMLTSVLTTAAAFGLAACDQTGRSSSVQTPAAAAASPDALPAGVFLAAAPQGARSLGEVKKDAADGEEVVVNARIAGREDPFVAGRAVMTVADAGFPTCTESGPMENCATPWDFCCSAPEDVVANTAAVQVVGGDGRPLKATLENAGGLRPNTRVVVRGVVKKSPDNAALMINATGIYVVQ